MTSEDKPPETAPPPESGKTSEGTAADSLSSQRVFKKSSPNNKLTMYLSSRDLVVSSGRIDRLQGVLLVDPEFVENRKVYGQVTLTFSLQTVQFTSCSILMKLWLMNITKIRLLSMRSNARHLFVSRGMFMTRYGREDEEVMGLKFCNEAIMCLAQLYPPHPAAQPPEGNTPLQEALLKRLGSNAYPFSMEITPLAPPSVQLVPAKEYSGAPIGTSYDVRAYIADRADEKLHRKTTVRMGIRVVQRAFAPPSPHHYNPCVFSRAQQKERNKQNKKILFGCRSTPLEVKFPKDQQQKARSMETGLEQHRPEVERDLSTTPSHTPPSAANLLTVEYNNERNESLNLHRTAAEKLNIAENNGRESTRVSFGSTLTNGTSELVNGAIESHELSVTNENVAKVEDDLTEDISTRRKKDSKTREEEQLENEEAVREEEYENKDQEQHGDEEQQQPPDTGLTETDNELNIQQEFRSLCGGKRPSLAAYLAGVPAPCASVEKPFLLSEGKVHLLASLDKAIYSHGEEVHVFVQIKNNSSKTIRRIKVFVVQHVDVCMFSNGKFKNVVAMINSKENCPITSNTIHEETFTLLPVKSSTKNWIALEDSYTKTGTSLASTVTSSVNNPDERNVFAIYVSYYVKVKLLVSVMGGEVSLKLPFTLMHTCSDFEHSETLCRVTKPVDLKLDTSMAEKRTQQEAAHEVEPEDGGT